MPLPLIPLVVAGITAASAALAGKKGVDSYNNIKETKIIAEETERQYKKVYTLFEEQREQTNNEFENYGTLKLEILSTSMAEFVGEFSKLKHVDFTDNTVLDNIGKAKNVNMFLREVEKQAVKAAQVMTAGVSSIAGGGLAAMGALGAATTFGAASTGTAIASLTGVAATNATLAFFGGGSLAAGGLGMAGGMAVLGGIALAPALAIGSVIFATSTEKKLAEIKIQQAEVEVEKEKLKSAIHVMSNIQRYTVKFKNLAEEMNILFIRKIMQLSLIIDKVGVEYPAFSEEEKLIVQQTYKLAVTMKYLLDISILTDDGDLSPSLDGVLEKATVSMA